MSNFEQKQEKAKEFTSDKIILFNSGNNYEAIAGDADIISVFLDLPIKTHKIKNDFFGIKKHHFIKFSKSLFPLLTEKLNNRLDIVII